MSAPTIGAPPGMLKSHSTLVRFPTSVGILLGISLCVHLAALTYAVVGEGLTAATSFVLGQFTLSLGLLRLYNGAWVLQDIRMPMVVLLFLYGCTLPAISLMRESEWTGLTEAAVLFGTAYVGFNLVQWWYKQQWQDVPVESFDSIRPSFANAALVLIAFIAVIGYAWVRGTRAFLTLDRTQMSWLYTQAWVVAMMMMNGFAMYLFAGWPRLSKNARRFVVVTLIAFVILHIGLGNRRDFIAMALFLVGMIASRRHATIGIRTIILAMLTFVVMMSLGVARQLRAKPWMAYSTNRLLLVAEQNEFVMPIRTVMYYATADKPLKYGLTYITAPTVFIPRRLWPEKPIGLSLQFNRDQFGDAIVPGYAYTPVTEAFINFSFVGPFVVMSLVSLATVLLVKHARRRPMLYFTSFALTLEFNRGSSAGVLYFLVVVGVAYALMRVVSRIEWSPKSLHGMWPPPIAVERVSPG